MHNVIQCGQTKFPDTLRMQEKAAQTQEPYNPMIRDMPADMRPRERMIGLGAGALSNSDLIAILLRTGVTGENVLSLSNKLLSRLGGLSGLSDATIGDMCELHGISEAKACQVMAAVELGKRAASMNPQHRPTIGSPEDVNNLVGLEMSHLTQEKLRVLLLNTKNRVMTMRDVYQGTVNSASVRVAEILRPAVRENCPYIIVVHNHPSGDPTPSPEDILVTRRLNQSADMMDIELLDHIVIGQKSFVSMKQRNLGF